MLVTRATERDEKGQCPNFRFLSAFRICFAPLRETKLSENEFRAKAQSGIERGKGKPGHPKKDFSLRVDPFAINMWAILFRHIF
jgi:hypothetical protein